MGRGMEVEVEVLEMKGRMCVERVAFSSQPVLAADALVSSV